MRKKWISYLCVLLSAVILATSLFFFSTAQSGRYTPITDEDALHTAGEYLENENGERVFLRGINLGGWLIQEDWFCPADNGKQGDHYTLETLISRFGTEKAYELYDIYQDAWMQETDFMNIADMGFNCVRIPFWYRNFQSDDNGTWILNEEGEVDLSRLEWAVEMCRKYGLYAILDLHGANGCQGMQDHCGQINNYHFFDQNAQGEEYRRQAVELWRTIAFRFAGDPAVAMFDLLNEPMCDVPLLQRNHAHVNAFYDDAYHAIREVDPNRMITMIGTWDIGKLPSPSSMGWTNVVYQFHQYDQFMINYTGRVDRAYLCNYNVPLFAGEFHPTGEDLNLRDVIEVYDTRNVMWALWTYKGYNSWAAWADWFAYGSTEDSLIVHPETDSYEEIARKWGAMGTNSGNFYKGHLFDVAYEFLPDAVSASIPFNREEDLTEAPTTQAPTTTEAPTTASPTAPPDEPGNATLPTAPSASSDTTAAAVPLSFDAEDIAIDEQTIVIRRKSISPDELRSAARYSGDLILPDKQTIGTGDTLRYGQDVYTLVLFRDCNGDGRITSADARAALRHTVHLQTLSEPQQIAADSDQSGRITTSDARRILRYSLGLIS